MKLRNLILAAMALVAVSSCKSQYELLLNTNLPIAAIAERTGYQNQRSFYKMFLQQYHMTCGEMRQKYSK